MTAPLDLSLGPFRAPKPAEAGGMIGGQSEARSASFKCLDCALRYADVASLKLHQKRVHQPPNLPPIKGDSRQNSIDGMPVCKFCNRGTIFVGVLQVGTARPCGEPSRKRRRPQQQTVLNDANPTASSAPPLNDAVDVQQGTDQAAACQADMPLAVIRALSLLLKQWMDIAQHTHILDQLKHRCCVCSQWIANIRSVKLHVLKVQPEIYKTTGAAALAGCKNVDHLVSPCRFCGTQMSKTSQHAGACPVLWQIRLGALLANQTAAASTDGCHGHGSGRGELLRVSPPSEAAGPRRGAAHHGAETCQIAGKRKRPRQDPDEATEP